MQFNSLYFILFFLPLTILGYYFIGRRSHKAADWFLIGASVLFYGFTDVWYPVMLGVLILVNWRLTRMIRRDGSPEVPAFLSSCSRSPSSPEASAVSGSAPSGPDAMQGMSGASDTQTPPRRRNTVPAKTWMIIGIVLNAAILGIFKYTDFFIENLNVLFRQDWTAVNLILPLGISFIIFSQISWIVDVYRGEADSVCFREYVLYSSFFPKLSQGPITLMKDFLPQMRKEERFRFCSDDMVIGIQMFVCGLGKKVLLADVLGVGVEWYFDTIVYRSRMDSLIVMLVYTFQIYMDFSGYSDMALGVSRMLGFDLPANFNSPYKACTVTDFWRRWHISLTTFLREYIYFPLGGSRAGKVRTYLNILIVYLVSGLWHGASWSYVLWGLFHGLAQIAERLSGRLYRRVPKPLRWLVTFGFVNLMWMVFYCGSWSGFTRYWWHLASVYNAWAPSADFMENFRIAGVAGVLSFLGLPAGQGAAGAVSLVLLLALCFFLCLCCPNNQERRYRNTVVSVLFTAGLLSLCLLSMSGVSTFIYNDF